MPTYNNYPFYQPYTYYPVQQPVMPTQTIQQTPQTTPQQNINGPITSGMIWVNNEQEAQAYPVAPNNAVALWDSNSSVVYIKQADASGRPYLKIYDLSERTQADPTEPKREELAAIKADFDAIRNELKLMKKDITNLKRKRDDLDDE